MMYYIDIGSSIIKRGHQMHVVESCASKYLFKYIFCTQGFQICLRRLYPHGFFISMNKDIREVAATTYSSDFHIFRDSKYLFKYIFSLPLQRPCGSEGRTL